MGRHLELSHTAIGSRAQQLRRKLQLPSMEALRIHAAAQAAPARAHAPRLSRMRLYSQSRWLPDVALRTSAPLGSACRQAFNGRTLRDVADFLRDCGQNPGPLPDDPGAVVMHATGTLGAKQALLAALAAECGRNDVQLIVACHELEVSDNNAAGNRLPTLPMAVCYLRCGARGIQIAALGAGSVLHDKAVSAMRVDPFGLANERVRLYQKFAVDWCRALDMSPAEFARYRAEQLRRPERRSVFEDLLGYHLPSSYAPVL